MTPLTERQHALLSVLSLTPTSTDDLADLASERGLAYLCHRAAGAVLLALAGKGLCKLSVEKLDGRARRFATLTPAGEAMLDDLWTQQEGRAA